MKLWKQLLATLVLWFWVRWDLHPHRLGKWDSSCDGAQGRGFTVNLCMRHLLHFTSNTFLGGRSYYHHFRDEKMQPYPGTHWWVMKLKFPPRSFWFQSYFYSPSGSERIQGTYRQRKKKQRHHFADKGLYSQSYGFSSSHAWIWELDYREGWALRNWCFQKSLLDPRRSNQSILKEINPEYSLGGLMLKLKLQYFGHLIWRADSLAKTMMLGKIEGQRRRKWQRMRWLDSITDSMDMHLSKVWEIVEDRGAWCATDHGVTKNRTLLSDWTTTYIVS